MRDSHIRSIIKGVTWRTLGSIDTIVLSFIVTGNLDHSLKIGLTEVVTKIILYYLHERLWNIIPLGRIHRKGPSHGRSLLKGVTWRAVGTLDTIFIAYVITGMPLNAITIGGFEVFTKIGLFYLHERIWSKVRWGRIIEENMVKENLDIEPSSLKAAIQRQELFVMDNSVKHRSEKNSVNINA